ncbi:MAG: zinc ribbon domain-containing protein [Treponema sp.]|jgi:hypothetical protein|nr:zinc ribbon domain-containing protein [Treponema sp.]
MGEKLINCKACGREIAKSAKICPHCGKKNKQPVLKVVLISAAVIIALSIIGNMSKTNTTSSTSNTQTGGNFTIARNNNTGIWGLGEYEDQFGNKTGEKYIAPKSTIRGKFSNPATENSDLDVQFVFSDENGVTIQLYEYGKKFGVPATAIGLEKINIAIQAGNGQQYNFTGGMTQTWVFFDVNDRETITQILLEGGNIKFRISIDSVGVRSSYSFDITNANGFDVIYQQYNPGQI